MSSTIEYAPRAVMYGTGVSPYGYGAYAGANMPPYGGVMPATPATGGAVAPSVPGGVPTAPTPGAPVGVPSGAYVTPTGGNIVTVPQEESYVENILRMNRGRIATAYMTYENNREWNAKIFKGVIEAAGRDHLILSDPLTGRRFLLLTVNLDYVTFDEPIAYAYPYRGGVVSNIATAENGG